LVVTAEQRAKNRSHFKAFWDLYPRKVGGGEAERVFTEVVVGTLSHPPVPAADIIDKARAFARSVDIDKLEFVPYPAKWLKDRRFEDADLFTDQNAAAKEWLMGCYQRVDVAAVENRMRMKMPRHNIPEGMTDADEIRHWYKGKAREWILEVVKGV
jgi:hypothetical protein